MSSQTTAYQGRRHLQLRIWLLEHGLSQRAIARRLGVSPQYLNQVLLGRKPGLGIRRRLVRELGFPEDLIAYEPDKRKAA